MTDFLTRYPQTQVELIALERTVNLVEERIDLAVRIGNVLDDSLVARKLGVCRSVVCASPAYIKASGQPQRPDDLDATAASPMPTSAAPSSAFNAMARRSGFP